VLGPGRNSSVAAAAFCIQSPGGTAASGAPQAERERLWGRGSVEEEEEGGGEGERERERERERRTWSPLTRLC